MQRFVLGMNQFRLVLIPLGKQESPLTLFKFTQHHLTVIMLLSSPTPIILFNVSGHSKVSHPPADEQEMVGEFELYFEKLSLMNLVVIIQLQYFSEI